MQDRGRVGGRAHGAQSNMRSPSISPCTGDSSGSSDAGRKKRNSRRKHSARNARHGKEPMSLKAVAEAARGGRRKDIEEKDANDSGGEQEDQVEPEQGKQGKLRKNGLVSTKELGSPGAEANEQPPQASAPQETDRMRAALEALKRRRADLDAAQADLEASRKTAASLQAQLDAAKADLEAEKDAKASAAAHSVVQQSQLSASQVELDAALKWKASFKGELDTLQQQLKDEQSKAEELTKELGALQQEKEALRLKHAEVQTELDEAHRGRVQMADEAKMLQSKLNATVSESQDLRMVNMSLTSKVDRLHEELRASEAEVDQLQAVRGALIRDASEGATRREDRWHSDRSSGLPAGLAPAALVELEVAWESFVGTGLRRLHTALLGAGVRTSSNLGASLRSASAASASAAWAETMTPAPAASSTVRKDPKDPLEGTARNDKKEKRSEKKAAKKGRRNGLTFTDPAPPKLERKGSDREALVAQNTLSLTPRSSPHESDSSSQEFGDCLGPDRGRKRTPLPHRTSRAQRPAIRRRRNQSPITPSGRITFAAGDSLVSEVSVTSYRPCSEALWFTDPQASVFCEGCRRRVPQKRGRLRGAPGHASSFMCDEFVCNECADGEE